VSVVEVHMRALVLILALGTAAGPAYAGDYARAAADFKQLLARNPTLKYFHDGMRIKEGAVKATRQRALGRAAFYAGVLTTAHTGSLVPAAIGGTGAGLIWPDGVQARAAERRARTETVKEALSRAEYMGPASYRLTSEQLSGMIKSGFINWIPSPREE
jgi:hypothetical protein